jgi:hypothetical protein
MLDSLNPLANYYLALVRDRIIESFQDVLAVKKTDVVIGTIPPLGAGFLASGSCGTHRVETRVIVSIGGLIRLPSS